MEKYRAYYDETIIEVFKADNDKETYYTAKNLKKLYGDTFKTYMYDTLKLKQGSTCYSYSGQTSNLGTSLILSIIQ